MSQTRLDLVSKAFDILDKNKNGTISFHEIKEKYDTSRHPDVQSGKKTADEALMEFIETFEIHHNTYSGSRPDGNITKEEFVEYYNNISCSVDNDSYFQLMMNNAWNLDGKSDPNNMSYAGGKSKATTFSAREAWK